MESLPHWALHAILFMAGFGAALMLVIVCSALFAGGRADEESETAWRALQAERQKNLRHVDPSIVRTLAARPRDREAARAEDSANRERSALVQRWGAFTVE